MIVRGRPRIKRYSGTLQPKVIGTILIVLSFAVVFFTRHSRPPKAVLTSTAPAASLSAPVKARKVYPLSVIHGGAYSQAEFERARRTDAVVAAHYADFGSKPKFQKLSQDMFMYVSYRRSNQVYWSKTKHRISQGETVISDGNCMARARCGNRLSAKPQGPVAPKEVSEASMNTPESPDQPVSYVLAELPAPQGRPFDLDLPVAFGDSSTTVPVTPVAHVAGSPVGGNALGTYFAPGPGIGGIGGGGGSGPAANSSATNTVATPATSSVPGSTTSTLPTTTTGGTSLPVSPSYPGPGDSTVPGTTTETTIGLVPEPQSLSYSLLALALASIWLARRGARPSPLGS